MRPKIISQPSASIKTHFTIPYCNKHSTLLGSQRVKTYGEYVYIAFYLILEYGLIFAVND